MIMTNLNSNAPQYEASPSTDGLMDDGYTIIRRAISRELVEAIDAELDERFRATPFCQGGFYGERTKRFGRLLVRSEHVAQLVMHPAIMTLAEKALGSWCDRIQLNLTQAIELHPGALPQLPHRDQDMWAGDIGQREYLINVMWPLTSFTEENGATLIWPGSHGPRALTDTGTAPRIIAEGEPGDAIVFLGSTLHGAGANHSTGVRRGIIISYSLGWLKPYENQWLAYPPHIARRFLRGLSELVGYVQHRPNLGNFEGQCPSILFDSDPDEALPAIDALRPDQAAMLRDHVAAQRDDVPGVRP
jgi:ectoine hydroxylase-related dioxygenase (phytanoyl-CoA dioxygenase family)